MAELCTARSAHLQSRQHSITHAPCRSGASTSPPPRTEAAPPLLPHDRGLVEPPDDTAATNDYSTSMAPTSLSLELSTSSMEASSASSVSTRKSFSSTVESPPSPDSLSSRWPATPPRSAAMLHRHSGHERAAGSTAMAQPACRRWRQGSRLSISPSCIGSKQMQHTSSGTMAARRSWNFSVTSSTIRSLSLISDTLTWRPPTDSRSINPSCSLSSLLASTIVKLPRSSMRAGRLCSLCHMSTIPCGRRHWKITGRFRCRRMGLSSPSITRRWPSASSRAVPPRKSDTRCRPRSTRGHSVKLSHRRSGTSSMPPTSANGVAMNTLSLTH
mmetsp:Transcript_32893/g.86300  ORF Transcript_32893/g.86300 Transcript_32893/m.86300 type:complete len:329 (-) Transcript_32893:276-1262(-)